MNISGYIKILNWRKAQKEQGFENKIQMYKILYQAYADEIKNLWQRSIFLGAFMVLVWTGYGTLQLKFIEKACQKDDTSYLIASLGLCGVIIILSLLWIAMAKASKFVQEAHEEHINTLKFDVIEKDKKRLFCDLNIYESKLDEKQKLSAICPLQAYRYAPSKINIALGWVSLLVGFILLVFHIYLYLKAQNPFLVVAIIDFIKHYILSFYFWSTLIFVVLLGIIVLCTLKGGSQSLLRCLICKFYAITQTLKNISKFFTNCKNFKTQIKQIWEECKKTNQKEAK